VSRVLVRPTTVRAVALGHRGCLISVVGCPRQRQLLCYQRMGQVLTVLSVPLPIDGSCICLLPGLTWQQQPGQHGLYGTHVVYLHHSGGSTQAACTMLVQGGLVQADSSVSCAACAGAPLLVAIRHHVCLCVLWQLVIGIRVARTASQSGQLRQ